MDRSFYKEAKTDFKYPEIGICMQDTTGDGKVKIFIPIATPTLSSNSIYDNKDLPISTRNIISDVSSMDIYPCTISNYITMKLPSSIESLKRNDKVILVFIGGDINKPVILGRYEE